MKNMLRISSPVLLFLVTILAALPDAGLAQVPLKMDIKSLDVTQFPLIQMKVHFMQDMQSFRHITQDDITLRENATFETVQLSCPINPIAVALVLDRSLSMAFKPNTMEWDPDSVRWRSCKNALVAFVQALNDWDYAAFITFCTNPQVEVPFTSDKKQLFDAIAGTRLGQYTALWQAGSSAVDLLSNRPESRAIVLLTDGANNPYPGTPNTRLIDVIRKAKAANVRVFTIGLGEDAGKTDLDSLARSTGGRFYFSATGDDLTTIYFEISQSLAADCILSYTSSNVCADSTRRDIHMVVTNGVNNAFADTMYYSPYRPELAQVTLPGEVFVQRNSVIRVPVSISLTKNANPFTFSGALSYPVKLMKFVGLNTAHTPLEGKPVQVVDDSGNVRIDFHLDSLGSETVVLFDLLFEAVETPVAAIDGIAWHTYSATGACPLLLSITGSRVFADAICDRILVKRFAGLNQNFPNPFSSSTALSFTIPPTQDATDPFVEIRVEDAFGRIIATPVAGRYAAGDHRVEWRSGTVPTGCYRAIMRVNGQSETITMMKVK